MLPQLTTFLFGAAPVGELRAAIPWGLTFGHLSSAETIFWALAGNIFATTLVVLLLPFVAAFAARNFKPLDRILQKIFAKTRAKHSKNFERFANLFLIIFVAIPLPGSGAWTAALIAWLFGVPPKIAIPLIAIGLAIAAGIVFGITTGAIAFARSV
ncbi:MAG: small multi-drug export protein [Patescibacteria group bacterium]